MINAKLVQQLRVQTGISMMECKKSLEEAKGDIKKAIEILRTKGELKAAAKAKRSTKEGLIESYIHSNGKIGVLLKICSETDFVAKSKEFKELAHNLAMHIAAMDPQYLSPEDIPKEFLMGERKIYREQFSDSGKPQKIIDQIVEGKIKKYSEEISLLTQPFVKNPDKTVQDIINEYIAKLGENIKVEKFVRYQI